MTDLTTVHDIDEAVTQRIGEGSTFPSILDGQEFRATYDMKKDIVMVFLPGRSTQGKTIRPVERIALWRKWMEDKTFDPVGYEDVSKHAEYLLTVLKDVEG